ncbi:response regulator [Flavitalea flava]
MLITPNCSQRILLADDDEDDCLLFEDALREICPENRNLRTAGDGRQLMQLLQDKDPVSPNVIFLDLNMPVKNGFECLDEIKQNEKLKDIPVVIFSTSQQSETISTVYKKGANLYIRKPGTFHQLKRVIERVLSIDWGNNGLQFPQEEFVL